MQDRHVISACASIFGANNVTLTFDDVGDGSHVADAPATLSGWLAGAVWSAAAIAGVVIAFSARLRCGVVPHKAHTFESGEVETSDNVPAARIVISR